MAVEKNKMKTTSIVDINIANIIKIFPNVISEDENGKAIDFDALKQELSNYIIEGNKERYSLNWPGKKQAQLTANLPITSTLRPDIAESEKFNFTKNIYIEGDNLEVLKLLQESYLNKIKMIYIDPPYNTGNDFIYNDDFTKNIEDELQDSGQKDHQGGRLVANLNSNGRYHSDWLSMMYPRLKIARNLLKEDGVIFISIDDNEAHNLRKICDEIFGEANFESFIWKKKGGASNTEKIIGTLTENVLCYFRNKRPGVFNYREIERTYKYKDDFGPYNLEGIEKTNLGTYNRPTMLFTIIDPKTKKEYTPSNDMRWTLGEETVKKLITDNKIYFDEDKKKVFRIKRPDDYLESENVYYNLLLESGSMSNGKDEIKNLLDNREFFVTPKPSKLIKDILKIASKKNDIILDFFSGSATTADAVMQLNAEDGGNRRFIMVQIPEEADEKSEAYKAGYKTICEIGKERIRRAGTKILEENKDKEGIENLDIGFRVFKVDSSNMKDVYYNPDEIRQDNLFDMVSNIKEDRTDLDLLFQVLLDSGVELTLPIEEKQIVGKKVYFVDGNVLAACFEDNLTEEFVTELAKCEDLLKVVFRDSSFGSDDSRINVEQIFKQYSPDTQIRVI